MIGLTLSLNDFFSHLKHVWVFVHIETCSKRVQVVTFEKVLERLPLKQCFRLKMSCMVIFQLWNVKIWIMSGDQSTARSSIWNIKFWQIQRRHYVFARTWILGWGISSLNSCSRGDSLWLFIYNWYLVCSINAILDYCAKSTVRQGFLRDFNFVCSISRQI